MRRAAQAKLIFGFGQLHLARFNFVLERLREASDKIDGGAELQNPILHHPLLTKRSGDRDDGADRNGRARDHADELGADREVTEQTHLDLGVRVARQ